MNILINKEENDYLYKLKKHEFIIGSHLYGTHNDRSDQDLLVIYKTSEVEMRAGLPTFHTFMYKDQKENKDIIYCSELQFWKNLNEGREPIFSDVLLFSNYIKDPITICRTYKTIKGYLGMAKRDLVQYKKEKKRLHAARCLYIAECLLKNENPSQEKIQSLDYSLQTVEYWNKKQKHLRIILNHEYEKNNIKTYYIPLIENPIWNKLLHSNNNKD